MAAKERGVHFGREAAPVSEDFPEILAEWRTKSSARGRRPSGWGIPDDVLKWAKAENLPKSENKVDFSFHL